MTTISRPQRNDARQRFVALVLFALVLAIVLLLVSWLGASLATVR